MASDVKWLKLMNNMFEDDKISYIESLPDGDTILIIWIKILCLASKSNTDGSLMITDELPYTPALLAHKFNKTTVQVEYALSIMQKLEMIEIVDDVIYVSNWIKYQSVDELAKIREQTRLRVAKCRERKKMLECNATSNDTVTEKSNENALISNSISNSNSIIIENNKEEDIVKKVKHKYGEYKNVLLTDEQYESLKEKFPFNYEEKIKNLDEGIELKGYKYKNHYLAILKWSKKDEKSQPLSDFERARRRLMDE